jgi:WhiB family transcriptional regulator, redox-sensing transcriptional regulator
MSDPTAWIYRAACASTDPEAFFPLEGGGYEAKKHALATCQGCPVRQDCLQYALENALDFGIYGGVTAKERKALGRPPKQRSELTLLGCGTAAGYRRHRVRGEQACRPCKDAEAQRSKVRRPPGTRAKRTAA